MVYIELCLICVILTFSALLSVHAISAEHSDNATTLDSGDYCPTWMHFSKSHNSCVCGVSHHHAVKCDVELNRVSVLRAGCYMMTLDPNSQEPIVGHSIYGCIPHFASIEPYFQVPTDKWKIDKEVCAPFNRTGRLCGACKKDFSPLVYSYDVYCMNCTSSANKHNWLRFVAVAFVPFTFFYMFILLFKFNTNSPSMHAFVFLAQIATQTFGTKTAAVQLKQHSPRFVILLQTFCGIWNLDFFRAVYTNICLNVTTMQTLTLNYLVAFYPLLLIALTCVFVSLHSEGYRLVRFIWNPFRKCLLCIKSHWNIKSSLIDVFATFILLSYNRLLDLSFSLLIYTVPFDSSNHYDGSKEYFGKEHLPYGVMAICVSVFFILLPFLLLLLYPMKWFQRLLNHSRLSCISLHTFVDSFTGYYKDGTESGTQDCRYFAALFLLLRPLNYVAFVVTMNSMYFAVYSIVLVCFTIAFVLAHPYKQKYSHHIITTSLILMVTIVTYCCGMGVSIAVLKMPQAVDSFLYIAFVMLLLPIIYITGLLLMWFYHHTSCKRIVLSLPFVIRGDNLERMSDRSLLSPSALKHSYYGSMD